MAKAETKAAAAAAAAEAADIAALSFEKAMEELEGIVSRLERGDVPLEQSVAIYERGEALKAYCEKLLRAAEDKVEKIRLSKDGRTEGGRPAGLEPLDKDA